MQLTLWHCDHDLAIFIYFCKKCAEDVLVICFFQKDYFLHSSMDAFIWKCAFFKWPLEYAVDRKHWFLLIHFITVAKNKFDNNPITIYSFHILHVHYLWRDVLIIPNIWTLWPWHWHPEELIVIWHKNISKPSSLCLERHLIEAHSFIGSLWSLQLNSIYHIWSGSNVLYIWHIWTRMKPGEWLV